MISELRLEFKKKVSTDPKNGLEKLISFISHESQILNDLMLVIGVYYKLEKEERNGTVSESIAMARRNKFLLSSLEVIDKITILDIIDYEAVMSHIIHNEPFLPKVDQTDKLKNESVKKAMIVDSRKVFSSINRTKCLDWTDPKIKQNAGENGWGKFTPQNGMIGEVVNVLKHCRTKEKVYILKIRTCFVPIGEKGVEMIY